MANCLGGRSASVCALKIYRGYKNQVGTSFTFFQLYEALFRSSLSTFSKECVLMVRTEELKIDLLVTSFILIHWNRALINQLLTFGCNSLVLQVPNFAKRDTAVIFIKYSRENFATAINVETFIGLRQSLSSIILMFVVLFRQFMV